MLYIFCLNKCKTKSNLTIFISKLSVALAICFSERGLAVSANTYCISKNESPKLQVEEQVSKDETRLFFSPIKIVRDGKQFNIIVDRGKKFLSIVREENNKKVFQLKNFLDKDEWIRNLYKTENEWLLINTGSNNYLAKINFNVSEPRLTSLTKLPAFYSQKCGFLSKLLGGCLVSKPSYSPILDRIFLSGFTSTDSGQVWETVEIVAGKINKLSSQKAINNLVADIGKFRGVIFAGFESQVLFYDGKKVVQLAKFPHKRWEDTSPQWNIHGAHSYQVEYFKGRVFVNNFSNSAVPKLLMELKEENELTPILLPEDLAMKDTWLSLLTMPDNSRLWIITEKYILVEVADSFIKAVSIPNYHYIQAYSIGNLVDGSITFNVINNKNKSSVKYYIRYVEAKDDCKQILNENGLPLPTIKL